VVSWPADRGAHPPHWVELRGFEPRTLSVRMRCATGLRYSPVCRARRRPPPGPVFPGQPVAGGQPARVLLVTRSYRFTRDAVHVEPRRFERLTC
jgi:hypothetical protein